MIVSAKKIIIHIILKSLIIFVALGLAGAIFIGKAYAFDAGNIMSDYKFTNSSAMDDIAIQNFLNSKNSACLKNWVDPADGRSAARIIVDHARDFGINPQVLLVTLQKEQGFITRSDCPEWRYRTAMGFACPDNGSCDPAYYGFAKQIYQAARHFRNYFDQTAGWYIPYRPGVRYISYHPNGGCGGSNVNIVNRATASLYSYTPYQPNTAALNNMYGYGDGCSSYGNRNFWRDMNDWFPGDFYTPLIKLGNNPTYYYELSGYAYPVPSFEILNAYGLGGYQVMTVSQSYIDSLTIGPWLTRLAKFGTDPTVFIINGGKKNGVPNVETLALYGLSTNYVDWTIYDTALGSVLPNGNQVTNIARRPSGGTYLIENQRKRGFPDPVSFAGLGDPPYVTRALTNFSDEFINTIPEGFPMLLDGSVVRTTDGPAIYIFDQNKLWLFTPETYTAWGGGVNYSYPNSLINQVPGGFANAPYLIKDASNNKYLVDKAAKKQFSSEVQTQWGVASELFTQMSNRALARLATRSATTLIRGTNGSVYIVENAKKHGFPSGEDFINYGYSWGQVDNVGSLAENLLSAGNIVYAQGSLLRAPEGTVYLIDRGFKYFTVPSMTVFAQSGFNWSMVRNIVPGVLTGYTNVGELRVLMKDSSTNNIYLIDAYRKFLTSPQLLTDYGLDGGSAITVSPQLLARFINAGTLSRFVRRDGPTVYMVQNGQKNPFSSEAAFYANGGTWNNVWHMSYQLIDSLPTGSSL